MPRQEKAAREEAEEEAELIRLSEGWARARAVQFERCSACRPGGDNVTGIGACVFSLFGIWC